MKHFNVFSLQTTLNTQGSYDSKVSLAQIFTLTGTYKGQVVALKKITKRNIDITRDMKKEMKMVKLKSMLKQLLCGVHIGNLYIFGVCLCMFDCPYF